MLHFILVNDAAHTDQTQFLIASNLKNGELLLQGTRHIFSESNPFADFASGGRISEIHLLAEQMGIKKVETPPAEEFRAVLDRFRERFCLKPSTVKPRRPIVHATSASLGAASVVADKDEHNGRPLVPFYPCALCDSHHHARKRPQSRRLLKRSSWIRGRPLTMMSQFPLAKTFPDTTSCVPYTPGLMR
jgi:hypothetical protein